MALSLSCPCGARFEVEDLLAGQTVRCPECQQSVQAPALGEKRLRTSGFAVASVVVALVLAFTGVGPVLAVVLGLIGLIHIRKSPGALAGTGYALLGISLGAIFSVLSGLAVIQAEVFGFDQLVREGVMGKDVDRDGPLEVSRPADGFAIRRPSTKWGVARDSLTRDLAPGSRVLLANIAKDAYIDVSHEDLAGRTLEAFRTDLLESYKDNRDDWNRVQSGLPLRGLVVRKSEKLPDGDDRESMEVLLDVKVGPQPMTFLVRIVHPTGSDHVFLIRGWAQRRRFPLVEAEIRQAMDSFRLLNP
jgi:hypothetical protein